MDLCLDLCLISREPILHKITLPCFHSFDYYYLYLEVQEQKKTKKIMNCPYCRKEYDFTLPYYEIDNVYKILNVNYNQRKTIFILKCQKCNKPAHKFKNGVYCMTHRESITETCQAICKNGNKCKYKTNSIFCKKHKK